MDTRILTCIGCPMGCQLTVELEDGKFVSVTGNTCKRGVDYAKDEIAAPTRMVTSVVPVADRKAPLCVKTERAIPKELIYPCLEAIRQADVKVPVTIGDVIVPDVCGTGVNVVATRNLD